MPVYYSEKLIYECWGCLTSDSYPVLEQSPLRKEISKLVLAIDDSIPLDPSKSSTMICVEDALFDDLASVPCIESLSVSGIELKFKSPTNAGVSADIKHIVNCDLDGKEGYLTASQLNHTAYKGFTDIRICCVIGCDSVIDQSSIADFDIV